MPRPTPLYTRIRAAPAYAQSMPDLRGRYRILTQQVPEGINSLPTTSATSLDPAEREAYLDEQVSLLAFISQQNFPYHAPPGSRFSSSMSSTNEVEQIAYSQPVSSATASSIVDPAHHPSTPTTPIVFQYHLGNDYEFLRPAFTALSKKEREDRDLDAELAYIRFREDPNTVSHTHHFTSSTTAVIRTVNEEHFEVYLGPARTLAAGMRIVCHGDIVGEWFITSEMNRRPEYTVWKWLNHEARLYTVIRVPNKYVRPPCSSERVKRMANKLRGILKNVFK
ncbi:hypothetical protein C8R47DRAFT_1074456 [Mycena vitilis]|nr:hypothetical protein C8R47DRAFT_1074456 [Mycena vitilis]